VPGRDLDDAPAGLRAHALADGVDRRVGGAVAVDEGARQRRPARAVELQRHAVHAEGVRHLTPSQPVGVGALQPEIGRIGRRQRVVVRRRGGAPRRDDFRGVPLAPAFARQRHHRVDVHQLRHAHAARGQRVGRAGDHHAAVAVADEHDVVQLLGRDQAEHVVDVVLQRDVGPPQVRAIAVPGQRHRMHLVTGGAQGAEDAAPDPGSAPGAVHEDERAHAKSPSRTLGAGEGL
jgi:hypothetical protein